MVGQCELSPISLHKQATSYIIEDLGLPPALHHTTKHVHVYVGVDGHKETYLSTKCYVYQKCTEVAFTCLLASTFEHKLKHYGSIGHYAPSVHTHTSSETVNNTLGMPSLPRQTVEKDTQQKVG